ncbi:hypothetical protein LMG032447_01591 [Convivina praedatoris]|uniref:site-specific DNA-methyltransferase (adenine-specific) n=1 Tax=Convivina praedatoris TaxID=2880963 RepID=A0ABM9D3L1_9LACO|nr:hypothetical protein R077815_01568 [Convivina sp. LMG 32447]CAH1857567.1 hypothetical protein LMG032447_01591 [Convivina sp. LMG 32447]
MFLSTNIPTVVLVLKKNRTNHDVLFIDASKEFNKLNNKNELTRDNIDKIISTYKQRKSIDKYASVVSYEDFVENDFNLNIHRYVDTFEPEPVIPIGQTVKELFELDQEEQRLFSELSLSVNALVATQSLQDAHDLDKLKAYLNAKAKRKQVQAQQELL